MTAVTLSFIAPLPGLDPLVDFTLTEVQGAPGLYSLQAVHDPDVRLFVLDAATYAPAYSPVLPSDDATALDVAAPTEAQVLLVANPGPDEITVNAMAPVIVNTGTLRAAQVILDDPRLPVQAPLTALSA